MKEALWCNIVGKSKLSVTPLFPTSGPASPACPVDWNCFTVYLYCPFLRYLVFTLNLLHCHFYPYTDSLPRLRFSRTDDHSRLRFSEYMTTLFSESRTRICYQLYWQWRNEQEKHVRRNGGRVYSDRSFKPMPKFLSSTEAYKGVTQTLETKCWV